MSTSNNNGNSNGMGTGTGTMGRLLRLREQRAQELAALDTTIALLNGAAAVTKRGRAGSVLDEALALDAARVSKKRGSGISETRKRRKATLAFLESFDREKPGHGNGALVKSGIGTLLRHGYLKRKGDGYVRTGREFTVERP
jgi:hypothetical protein